MKTRFLLNSILGLGCAVLILAVVFQAQTAAKLQNQERDLRARSTTHSTPSLPAPADETHEGSPLTDQEVMELMRLRNETAQLHKRQRELAPAAQENTALRARQSTNSANAKSPFPPGYIRKQDAQFAGMHTPEAALQSFLYAMARHDTNTLFRVIDGQMLESLKAGIQHQGIDKFWTEADILPGVRVLKSTPISDTEISLNIEFAPGMDQQFVFVKIGGEWKISR
jgi:hypothetical protein